VRSQVLFLAAFLAVSCAGSDALYDPPGGRGFWARRSDIFTGTTSFYRVASIFAAASNNLIIYTEAKYPVPKSVVDSFTSAFENKIAPREHALFQKPTDVDANSKVILLLLDIQDGSTPGGAYIAGYYDPLNQFTDASVSSASKEYHSNYAEMVYIDYNPEYAKQSGYYSNLQSTLAHEYQHLLQFAKYFDSPDAELEPRWVDEGLAEVSSDITDFGPQTGRANNFRTALINSSALIDNEANPFLLENYAHSYIYFRFLADAYGNNGISAIFKESLVGHAGVDSALKKIDPGLINSCGSSANLQYPYFTCSYRMMWASLINGNLGDSPTGATIYFNGTSASNIAANSNFNYKTTVHSITYGQQLGESLTNGAFTVSSAPQTGALQSYAPKLYKINGSAPPPGFSTCSNCGLTMVVGTSYFAVFNHDYSQSTTKAASVVDQVQGEIQAPLALPAEVNANAPLSERALHWHFGVPKPLRESLRLK